MSIVFSRTEIVGFLIATTSWLLSQHCNAQDLPAALARIQQYHEVDAVPSNRSLHIVYWTPEDREPINEYRERLTRVLIDIQKFYQREMIRLGLGNKTFPLAVEPDGWLRVHLVRGKRPYTNYNVKSGSQIRNECLPVLEAAGIDANKETIVIFCNMSNWDPTTSKMSQNSPYYAGGGLRSGTAWQVDSALLDPQLLLDKETLLEDGQYGRISVGKYNSIFVGGVCHELGHALGLPHNMELPDERRTVGTSLMGSGNRTYGQELRNEGRGSFLALADGLRLASHPLFTSSEKGIDLKASAKLADVEIQVADDEKSFRLSSRIIADPPAYAVIGYIDPNGGSDYDAATVTAIPDHAGAFVLPCSTFKNSKATELRIVVCQVNGGHIDDHVLKIPFSVNGEGVIDLSGYLAISKLSGLTAAVKRNDTKAASAELTRIEQSSSTGSDNELLANVAKSLAGAIDLKPGPAPSAAEGTSCWLSESTSKVAKVGWLRPMVNRLPNDPVLLSISGQLFARGLYAHAPSTYIYELGGKWKRLSGFAGTADGHGGTVVFVILGDGKELWRSKKSTEPAPMNFAIDVSGIQELTLEVDDAGDGNAADWGVWTDVKIERD